MPASQTRQDRLAAASAAVVRCLDIDAPPWRTIAETDVYQDDTGVRLTAFAQAHVSLRGTAMTITAARSADSHRIYFSLVTGHRTTAVAPSWSWGTVFWSGASAMMALNGLFPRHHRRLRPRTVPTAGRDHGGAESVMVAS